MQPPEPQNREEITAHVHPQGERIHQLVWRTTIARRARVAEGLVLGTLIGISAFLLGFNEIVYTRLSQDILVLPSLAGVLLALSRGRRLLHCLTAIMIVALVLVGYTPLVDCLLPSLSRSDSLERVPALVVLSTAFHKIDKSLDASGQARAVHGFLLMQHGWAGTLVLTRNVPAIGDQSPTVIDQMHGLGLNFPVEQVGPVSNTHDEAVAVSRLARARGWNRIILVTQPWHMRRARGVFVKAGLDVICSPSAEGAYDSKDLSGPPGRLRAFKNLLHETIGILIYRLRGWM